jgi:phage terminase large subunit
MPLAITPRIVEVLRSFGMRETLDYGDIAELNVLFLEANCRMWERSMERMAAADAKDYKKLEELDKLDQPYRQKIFTCQHLIMYVRAKWWKFVGCKPGRIAQEKDRCSKDFQYFMNFYGRSFDPRLRHSKLPDTPFIPFLKQQEIVKSFDLWYKTGKSGLVDKSRDEGVSWLVVYWVLHKFLFNTGFKATLASEKEEKVDMVGSNDPLFGKLRFAMYGTPIYLRPVEFQKVTAGTDSERKIICPSLGNEIIGEIGTNIGRSGRKSVLVIDEYQDLSQPEKVSSAITSTAQTVLYIGTMRGMNHFYQLRESGRVGVESIRWYDDPRKNPSWKEGKVDIECPWRKWLEATASPVDIAQEHDGDPAASVEGAMIESKWVMSSIDWMEPNFEDCNVAGFDIATGRGNCEAVYVRRIGAVVFEAWIAPFKTPGECAWGAVGRGVEDGIELMNYDEDGLGESMVGMSDDEHPIPYKMVGLHGSNRASDEMLEEGIKGSRKFANKRAEMWWGLRKRFERTFETRQGIRKWPSAALISIPNDPKLITQLSQPRQTLRNGRIGVESKVDLKRRNVNDLGRADALVYAFDSSGDYEFVAGSFDYTNKKDSNVTVFDVDHTRGVFEQYVSMYQNEDLSVSCIGCMWFPEAHYEKRMGRIELCKQAMLQVFFEEVEMEIDTLVEVIKQKTRSEVFEIAEVIANDKMFNLENWTTSPHNMFARAGVYLRKNYDNDERGTVIAMNKLFAEGQIQIHSEKCKQTVAQLTQWHRSKGQVKDGGGLTKALCQLISRLRVLNKIPEEAKEDWRGYTNIKKAGVKMLVEGGV